MEKANYLTLMIQKSADSTDPHYLNEIAYNRPEAPYERFNELIEKFTKPRGFKKWFRKGPKKLTLEQLSYLFDEVLTYQNATYFKHREFFPVDYPTNIVEYVIVEEDEKAEPFDLNKWTSTVKGALQRYSNEEVTDHFADGLIAIGAFTDILKPYDLTIEDLHNAWEMYCQ